MVRLHHTIQIDATPDAVWDLLGDLAATPEWLPGTRAARMDGDIRTCTTTGGFDIREQISDYSAEQRTYSFRHLAVPMPVEDSSGSFAVEPDGDDRSRVTLDTSFTALDPRQEDQVRAMLDSALQQALASLKRTVQEGKRWDA
jgi:carbon monoxide dehydrogenase subunit G